MFVLLVVQEKEEFITFIRRKFQEKDDDIKQLRDEVCVHQRAIFAFCTYMAELSLVDRAFIR
jgi:hypothetical protein